MRGGWHCIGDDADEKDHRAHEEVRDQREASLAGFITTQAHEAHSSLLETFIRLFQGQHLITFPCAPLFKTPSSSPCHSRDQAHEVLGSPQIAAASSVFSDD